jgi:hypothetical protein
MNGFLSLLAVAPLLLANSAARADEVTSAPAPDKVHAADDSSSARLRFDLLGGVMAGSASSARVSAFAAAPALKLDLGVQIGDHAALYARAEGGTALLLNEGAVYFIGEWSPTSLLSVGTGIGYEGMSFLWVGGCESQCIQNSWSAVSVPFLFAVDLPHSAKTGARLRFEVELAGGYDPRTETWGGHGFLGIGGTWR